MKYTNTIKVTLLTTMALLIVPVVGTNAFSYTNDVSANSQINTPTGSEITSDVAPDDELLPLSANKAFKAPNGSKEKLGHAALKDFVDGYYVAGNKKGDNWFMDEEIRHNIIVQNFDTLVGRMDANIDVFLLDIQKQKAGGKYNPTEAEKKLYEWGIKIHPNPTVSENVTPSMMKQVLQVWKERLILGDVPFELERSDQAFWDIQRIKATCVHDKSCNPDDIGNNLTKSEPTGLAATSITHYTSISVVPSSNSCYQTVTCTLVGYKSGTGVLSASTPASVAHSPTKTVLVHSIDYITNGPQLAHYNIKTSGNVGFASLTKSKSTYNTSNVLDFSVSTTAKCRPSPTGCGTYGGSFTSQAPYY